MKLKIRLIWRKALTDFNGVVAEYVYKTDDIVLPEDAQAFQFPDTERMKNEGISISLQRRNILLCVCRAACEHFWFSKPIFRHEQAKARGRRQNMREMWTLVR